MFPSIAVAMLSAPAADLIDSLPGWTGPLPSKQYSGFLNSTLDPKFGQLHSHYWCAAACATLLSAHHKCAPSPAQVC